MKPIVIYGQAGQGKTTQLPNLFSDYLIIDEWDGRTKLAKNTIALTNVKSPYTQASIVIITLDEVIELLSEFSQWAQESQGIKHPVTPAMFPKGWPFFRDGWLQGRFNIIEKQ